MKKLILLLIVLNLFGCFGGYDDPKKVGIIEGYVIDILNGNTLSDTVVKVQDVSYVTAADGYFPLVRSGEDPYIIPKDSGDSYRIENSKYYLKTGVTIFSYGQKNLIAYLTPKPIIKEGALEPRRFVVAGQIYSDSTGENLNGATVVVNGIFTEIPYMEILDTNSSFMIKDIPESKINLYIFKNGYEPSSQVIDLSEDKLDLKIYLRENPDKKYGNVTGQVYGYNDETCGNSIVTIGQQGSNYYQFSMADSFGNYTIYGVVEGDNQLTVKSPGFYNPSPASKNQIKVEASKVTIHNIKMEYIKGEE